MVFISQLFTDVCIKGALLSTILGTCEIKEIDLQVGKKYHNEPCGWEVQGS